MADRHRREAALDDLGSRIEAAKAAHAPKPPGSLKGAARGWELAFRMVIELVVGIAIGGAIGYGVDTLLGTLPAFLLVFGMFGFAAGVRVMLRTAEEMNKRSGNGDAETPGAGARGQGEAKSED
ncbi:MAG: AtpZ/AtpI family protein [Pseudomonadota bacterium]